MLHAGGLTYALIWPDAPWAPGGLPPGLSVVDPGLPESGYRCTSVATLLVPGPATASPRHSGRPGGWIRRQTGWRPNAGRTAAYFSTAKSSGSPAELWEEVFEERHRRSSGPDQPVSWIGPSELIEAGPLRCRCSHLRAEETQDLVGTAGSNSEPASSAPSAEHRQTQGCVACAPHPGSPGQVTPDVSAPHRRHQCDQGCRRKCSTHHQQASLEDSSKAGTHRPAEPTMDGGREGHR